MKSFQFITVILTLNNITQSINVFLQNQIDEAEDLFINLGKENYPEKFEDDDFVQDCLDEGCFVQDDFQISITWSENKISLNQIKSVY